MNITKSHGTINVIILEDLKDHLIVEHNDYDNQLRSMINSSVVWAENKTERSLRDTTVTMKLDKFPENIINLTEGPVRSVTSVQYYDADNAIQTLTVDTDYRVDVDSNIGRVEPVNSWPTSYEKLNSVVVTYKTGYVTSGTPDEVTLPDDIKHAILIKAATMFEARTDLVIGHQVHDVKVAEMLLDPYKIYSYADQ